MPEGTCLFWLRQFADVHFGPKEGSVPTHSSVRKDSPASKDLASPSRLSPKARHVTHSTPYPAKLGLSVQVRAAVAIAHRFGDLAPLRMIALRERSAWLEYVASKTPVSVSRFANRFLVAAYSVWQTLMVATWCCSALYVQYASYVSVTRRVVAPLQAGSVAPTA